KVALRSKHEIANFPGGSPATPSGRHVMTSFAHRRRSFGYRGRESAKKQRRQVEQVVAHEPNLFGPESALVEKLLNHLVLGACALAQDADAEFPAAHADDSRVPSADDADLNATLLKHLEPVAIAHIEALHDLPGLPQIQRAVRQHAIHVEEHQAQPL